MANYWDIISWYTDRKKPVTYVSFLCRPNGRTDDNDDDDDDDTYEIIHNTDHSVPTAAPPRHYPSFPM